MLKIFLFSINLPFIQACFRDAINYGCCWLLFSNLEWVAASHSFFLIKIYLSQTPYLSQCSFLSKLILERILPHWVTHCPLNQKDVNSNCSLSSTFVEATLTATFGNWFSGHYSSCKGQDSEKLLFHRTKEKRLPTAKIWVSKQQLMCLEHIFFVLLYSLTRMTSAKTAKLFVSSLQAATERRRVQILTSIRTHSWKHASGIWISRQVHRIHSYLTTEFVFVTRQHPYITLFEVGLFS